MFNTLSDPILIVAFWTGLGALALTLLLTGEVVNLRMALRRQERREQATIAKWRPILNAAVVGELPDTLPRLRKSERLVFFKYWVHLHQSVRGHASAALNEVGRRLQCDTLARDLLKSRNRAERLLAILALGHLRDKTAWPQLLRQASASDSATSLHALWAMVQVDPRTAAESMTRSFIERDDWALSQVVAILEGARDACADILTANIAFLPAERLPRALHVAEALRIELPPAMLAAMLRHSSVDVLVSALRIAFTPAVLPDIRIYAGHEDWRVRVQVAKALGRIGERADIDVLKDMLGDKQWWVRYRAAQALVALPFLRPAEIDSLRASITDRYAADMLAQVIAEKETA